MSKDRALAADAAPGCQATPSAAASSRSGIPSAALLEGERYSPNQRRWIKARRNRAYRMFVYRDASDALLSGNLYIGQLFEDGWFHGTQLNQVLCHGSKAETRAYSPTQLSLTEIADFWERYGRIGRCVIDEAHDRYFVGDKTRWEVNGDERRCLWCGEHVQRLRRWLETVERERWEPASAGEAFGQDAEERLDAKHEHATRETGDAQ